ncbi:MAG: glycosyltransferase family 25 protein [Verrucomicrobiota bacterium]
MLKRTKNTLGRLPLNLLQAGYPGVADFLQRMICAGSSDSVKKRTLFFIRAVGFLYRRNSTQGTLASPDYQVFLINRDRDEDRLKTFDLRAKKFGIRYTRIPALDCTAPGFDFRSLDHKIGDSFNNTELFLKGAIGCFVSHTHAWKAFYESGEALGMICEDDARILGPIPRSFSDYKIPDDADLVFVNQRMVEGLLHPPFVPGSAFGDFQCVSLNVALPELMNVHSPISGSGADGYLLTRQGVKKLLRMNDSLKITIDLDWFLVFQGLTDEEFQAFLNSDPTLRFRAHTLQGERLNAYVLLPCLVEQANVLSSIRNQPTYYTREELIPAPLESC